MPAPGLDACVPGVAALGVAVAGTGREQTEGEHALGVPERERDRQRPAEAVADEDSRVVAHQRVEVGERGLAPVDVSGSSGPSGVVAEQIPRDEPGVVGERGDLRDHVAPVSPHP